MAGAGSSRRQITRTLHAAYAEGLLSEETLVTRLDQLLAPGPIDRHGLIGDLTLRPHRRDPWGRLLAILEGAWRRKPPLLLALDWDGGHDQIEIGRHDECDVVLSDLTVSRHHARLVFRDGAWILHDLRSTNGTVLNSRLVQRCEVRPGDRLRLGDVRLEID